MSICRSRLKLLQGNEYSEVKSIVLCCFGGLKPFHILFCELATEHSSFHGKRYNMANDHHPIEVRMFEGKLSLYLIICTGNYRYLEQRKELMIHGLIHLVQSC
ncbi:unnamed protein product [Onchocerca flexuosa]|uniref:Ovule protein n=1 Tax=Onchocerca flexuosa TaxID=387005 RepID=A0A183HY62_9BILA|nr:unnamed protein product [Onchocerca flexuosa]